MGCGVLGVYIPCERFVSRAVFFGKEKSGEGSAKAGKRHHTHTNYASRMALKRINKVCSPRLAASESAVGAEMVGFDWVL